MDAGRGGEDSYFCPCWQERSGRGGGEGGRVLRVNHKEHIYKKYHSVCPLVGIGSPPPPLSPASVPHPPEPKGGGAHSPAG